MRISQQALLFSLILGVIILCSCALVSLFVSQSLTGSASPEEEAAVGAVATAPRPSELPTAGPEFIPQPTLPEQRRLTLEFPPRIRAGDSDVVRLTLTVDELGNVTPTVEIEGNVITGERMEIPNLYETHNVIAEARIDMAGMEIAPPGLSGQTLGQGQTVTFRWNIRPSDTGIYHGTVWLFLRFVDKQNGEESQKAVSAQLIEIEAVNLFGLSGNLARTTGVIGAVVGTVLGFPFFSDLVKFIIQRRKM